MGRKKQEIYREGVVYFFNNRRLHSIEKEDNHILYRCNYMPNRSAEFDKFILPNPAITKALEPIVFEDMDLEYQSQFVWECTVRSIFQDINKNNRLFFKRGEFKHLL
jgi:hypothetical protein